MRAFRLTDDRYLDLRTLATLHGTSMAQEVSRLIDDATESYAESPATSESWKNMREALQLTAQGGSQA